jgi:hypothetical protein
MDMVAATRQVKNHLDALAYHLESVAETGPYNLIWETERLSQFLRAPETVRAFGWRIETTDHGFLDRLVREPARCKKEIVQCTPPCEFIDHPEECGGYDPE